MLGVVRDIEQSFARKLHPAFPGGELHRVAERRAGVEPYAGAVFQRDEALASVGDRQFVVERRLSGLFGDLGRRFVFHTVGAVADAAHAVDLSLGLPVELQPASVGERERHLVGRGVDGVGQLQRAFALARRRTGEERDSGGHDHGCGDARCGDGPAVQRAGGFAEARGGAEASESLAGVEPVVFRHAAGDVAAGHELLAERLEMRVAGQLFEFGRLAFAERAVEISDEKLGPVFQ